MHKFLKKLTMNEKVDCVYYVNYKYSFINKINYSVKGEKYIILQIKDASLSVKEACAVYLFFKNESEINFLQENYKGRTAYIKITGTCFSVYPNIKINASKVIPAKNITFDTSNLFPFSEFYKSELLSFSGKNNVPLRNTSSELFQEDYDCVDIGMKLKYKRIYNSPHDRYQINVFIEGIDDIFNIPAFLTPTMGKLIDEGYKFEIKVERVTEKYNDMNVGVRVNIKVI